MVGLSLSRLQQCSRRAAVCSKAVPDAYIRFFRFIVTFKRFHVLFWLRVTVRWKAVDCYCRYSTFFLFSRWHIFHLENEDQVVRKFMPHTFRRTLVHWSWAANNSRIDWIFSRKLTLCVFHFTWKSWKKKQKFGENNKLELFSAYRIEHPLEFCDGLLPFAWSVGSTVQKKKITRKKKTTRQNRKAGICFGNQP